MALVHLHGHGHHSLLDGVGTELQRAKRAAELGQPAIALTDHANLSGQMYHRRACMDREKGVGIMSIHGVETYFRPSRLPHEKSNFEFFHMVLLAKNGIGWRNLMLLTSEAYRSGFYRKPCIDLELLEKYSEGVIASTSCFSGWVPRAIVAGDSTEAMRRARVLQSYFGDDLYFAIQPHDMDEQREINKGVVNIAAELGAPVAAEQDQHYVEPEHWDTQDIALMIQTRQTFNKRQTKRDAEEKVYEFHAKTLYITAEDEMQKMFVDWHPDLPVSLVRESIGNTEAIANRCVPFFIDTSEKLPTYFDKVPGDVPDERALLRKWSMEGLTNLGLDQDERYVTAVDRELDIFEEIGMIPFFLITADMMRFARDHKISVGPGRGSAAGSVVCYATSITFADPIAYELLFERFINKDRRGMPDIDIDFDPERVAEVENYIIDKYGKERVVNLISFQTFGAKRALKDVARVFDVDNGIVNAVTKQIDDKLTDERLEDLRDMIQAVAKFAEENPEVWTHACRLQGQVAGIGEHPAGLVVGDVDNLAERLPLMKKAKDDDYMVTAWGESADYTVISKLGLLKIDMLRIKELTKQRYALDIIEEQTGERPDLLRLDVSKDAYAVDEDVMENFRLGLTQGIWQFGGSAGFTNLLRKIRPQNILHLAAANALYRPGVDTDMRNEFAGRKNGEIDWEYWHPAVEPFLASTFGILTYQEQVMRIVEVIGGFTPLEADDVRRIISKEYRQKGGAAKVTIDRLRARFVKYATETLGMSAEFANMIFDMVGGFAEYSFNFSHALVYALISYHDMWLKTKYPTAFYAAQLSYPPSGDRKIGYFDKNIREARTQGIKILPPDINESNVGFTVTKDGIRFGLQQVKGIGPVAAKEIMAKRPFANVDEVLEKTDRSVDRGSTKAMMECGAFDRWGARTLMSQEEKSNFERERLGVSLSIQDRIASYAPYISERCHTEAEVEEALHGAPIMIGGEVISGDERLTRNGKIYCVLEVAFGANTYRLKLWSNVYLPNKEILDTEEPLIFRGWKDGSWDQVVVDEVQRISELYTPPSTNGRVKADALLAI